MGSLDLGQGRHIFLGMKWIAIALLAAPAWADCPAAPDHGAAYAAIYPQLKRATGEMEARALSGELWALWLQAPDPPSQVMLDRGVRQLRAQDLEGAKATLSELVAYCPDYAEGWNQRAFAAFLGGELGPALRDLDRALAINPAHLGALTGKGLTLLGLGRDDEAQKVLRDAVSLNPWLRERELLDGPVPQDI